MNAAPPPAALRLSDDEPLRTNDTTASANKMTLSENIDGRSEEEKFTSLWGQFYVQAQSTITSSSSSNQEVKEGTSEALERKHVLKVLDNFQRLIFALDKDKKSIAVNYDKGGLELILYLIGDSTFDDEDVTVAALKCIKSCVVKNPQGKSRCRRAGVFGYFSCILETCCHGRREKITEEALTTLAAICIGDDLNALIGFLLHKEMIEKLSSIHSSNTNVKNMSTYLLTLFTKIQSELPILETMIDSDTATTFVDILLKTEKYRAEAKDALKSQQFGFAEGKLTNAINVLSQQENFFLPVIREALGELYSDRAICRLETGYHESALSDADSSLKWTDGIQQRLVRSKVLKILGREEEAKQEIGKANLILNQANS
mmetsp:Transcript_21008/g.25992  ORF Transcript_21008/g.25992 Transcript_21008/m.25992 type:complete len:374 (-) Transcript_21008:106-1227(-)